MQAGGKGSCVVCVDLQAVGVLEFFGVEPEAPTDLSSKKVAHSETGPFLQ